MEIMAPSWLVMVRAFLHSSGDALHVIIINMVLTDILYHDAPWFMMKLNEITSCVLNAFLF